MKIAKKSVRRTPCALLMSCHQIVGHSRSKSKSMEMTYKELLAMLKKRLTRNNLKEFVVKVTQKSKILLTLMIK